MTDFYRCFQTSYLGFVPILLSSEKDGLIIEINSSGDVIGRLESTNGKMQLLSQITLGEKHAYIVSPFRNKIWRIERQLLQPKQ
jgi:hypothetical protein